MVSLPDAVKAEIVRGGSGKRDYRNPGAVEKMKMREYNFYLFLKTSLHRNSKGFPLPSSLET